MYRHKNVSFQMCYPYFIPRKNYYVWDTNSVDGFDISRLDSQRSPEMQPTVLNHTDQQSTGKINLFLGFKGNIFHKCALF